MKTTTRLGKALAVAIAIGVLTATVATAGGPPDKSGGTQPVTLKLLNSDGDLSGLPAVQRFIDRVHELSKGAITIEVVLQNDGHAGFERRVVQDVRAGKAQLAWVGTRVWDTLGVDSFRALHAPMLINSYALEGAVLRSDLPVKMLAGMQGHGIVGIALLGDNLRYPAGKRPLAAPADFRGLWFRSLTSATQAAAVRALGARPSEQGWAELANALQSGRVDALEVDLHTYDGNHYSSVAPYLTVNVALWPRTTTLIANEAALGKLSDQQSRWIRQAARAAAAYSLTTFGEDRGLVAFDCRNSGMKAVIASPAQLSALQKSFAPVYASLRKDARTAAMIDAIVALKRNVKPTPLAVPKGCLAAPQRSTAAARAASFPEGVYRIKRTQADVVRTWPSATADMIRLLTATVTVDFKDGRLDFRLSAGGIPDCRHASGTYSTKGQTVTVRFTDFHGCPLFDGPGPRTPLRWSTDGKSLRLRVNRPTDGLMLVTWETKPFVRIG